MASKRDITSPAETPAAPTWRTKLRSFLPFFGRVEETAPMPAKSEHTITSVGARLTSCTVKGGSVELDFDSKMRIVMPIPEEASLMVRASNSDYQPMKDSESLAAAISRHFKGKTIAVMTSDKNMKNGTGIALMSGDIPHLYIDSSKKIAPIIAKIE